MNDATPQSPAEAPAPLIPATPAPGIPASACTVHLDLSGLKIERTDDVDALDSVLRQPRAFNSLELAVTIRRANYHAFVSGPPGTGRRTLVRQMLSRIAPTRPVPPDWIYVHSFTDSEAPRAIRLAPGQGQVFADAMASLLEDLLEDLPQAFSAPDHQARLQQFLGANHVATGEAMMQLRHDAAQIGFEVSASDEGGLTARPMVDGEAIDEEAHFALDEAARADVDARRAMLEPLISKFVKTTRELEHRTEDVVEEMQRELGEGIVAPAMAAVAEEFSEGGEAMTEFLDELRDHVLDGMELFVGSPEERAQASGDPMAPFKVNVVIDHSDTKGAPVIMENQPSFYRMFGKIERRVEQGIYSTDHTMIQAGALAQASGGFLVCHAEDLLQFPGVWDGLKLSLRNGEVAIVDLGETSGLLPTSGLKPEPIPLDVKLVVLGRDSTYHALYQADPDFRKMFQVRVDFDDEITRNPETIEAYIRFIAGSVKHNQCRPLDASGIEEVLRHSSRLAESQERMTLQANIIGNLLVEADYYAARADAEVIEAKHVLTAIAERVTRSSLIADKMDEDLYSGSVLIDAVGEAIGVVNGLAVLATGEHSFGRPYRITARCFAGSAGVVNIEREVALSGDVHDKGVHIIGGFLGDRFARRAPLSMTASVAFEQSYSTVDGDSASSTWLFAILSSLAELPIRQGVAVTGSVNQLGDIQPVGGVTEKVEGFYRFCAARGLTGDQGVMLPALNVKDLLLDADVRAAIDAGQFHVWPIRTIEEGLEHLLGVVAGELREDGTYPEGTVLNRVAARLDLLREAARDEDDDD